MKIPIIFLGTSQAIPTATRNHISILLIYKNENILIDCGEGTQRQFRKIKINPCKITKLLITHWHGDHVLGIPGLMQTLALNHYKKTLEIYGPRGTKKFVKELSKVFIPRGKINIKVKEGTGKLIETPDFILTAVPLQHGAPCNAYIFQEKNKTRIDKNKILKLKIKNPELIKQILKGKSIKIKGKIIKTKELTYMQKGKKISFILDTKYLKLPQTKYSDLAVIESTYSSKEKDLASRYKHLTAEQAAKISKENKIKKLILTHISQRYEHKENILLNEAKKIFKNTSISNDLMKVEV